MKKLLLPIFALCCGLAAAQNNRQTIIPGFDEQKALQEAKDRGLAPVDYAGYVKNRYNAWLQHGTLKVAQKPTAQRGSNPGLLSATNIDFENGNYNGWQLFAGENMVSSNGPLSNLHAVSPGLTDSIYSIYSNNGGTNNCNMSDTAARQGLMTNYWGTDPACGIPLTSPMGGNYVARVNRFCTSMEGAVLTQTFAVTPSQSVLNYAYAVVLEDGGHLWGEQTYFMVRVFDQSGGLIDSVYMQAANGTTPGFYPSNYSNTYFKPWTPVSVNLTSYVGQNVTLEVTAADCIYGGHSGYAYFDAALDSVTSTPNVWPGDANYDLTADMNDLLYLGWAYGATGPVRPSATNNWQAEPSANWGQSTAYGTEFKHADCNGDGVIDINDTAAISLNYSQQHAFRLSNHAQTASQSSYRNVQLTPNNTTVGPNQPLTITVSLPTNTVTATNDIYGIAFRLTVPSQYIGSMSNADFSNSFLGNTGNMLTLTRAFVAQDHIDICLVRNNHTDISGGGNLVDVNLVANNFSASGVGTFGVSDIKAVTYGGLELPVGSYTTQVNFSTSTGISKINTAEVRILPNPASDKICVEGVAEKTPFEIINVIGQPVLKATLENKKWIDISGFEKGAYFIKLNSSQGIITRRFIKD